MIHKKSLFLFLIFFCLLVLYIYWNLLVKIKYSNYTRLKYLNDTKLDLSECFLKDLDEWDPKIKNLFKKLPVYGNCEKNVPFTFVKNNTIYFDLNVNETHYKGTFI